MKTANDNLFIRACFRMDVERTPVWIMRQAGRYSPRYQAIRKKHDFVMMLKNPDIAAEVTRIPLEEIGVDCAIIFSDILVIAETMGMKLKYVEKQGPHLEHPVQSIHDIKTLKISEPAIALEYALSAITKVKKSLPRDTSLIGFIGSPWTLFCYLVEGESSHNFYTARTFLLNEPAYSKVFLEKLSGVLLSYALAQIDAGAEAIQIFDSLAGFLSRDDLKEFSTYYSKEIIKGIKLKHPDVPVILFSKGTSRFLDDLISTECDVLSIDWTLDVDDAKSIVGNRVAIQGNLDPVVLLARPETVIEKAKIILKKWGMQNGHIFNLGHGILPDTPVENAKALVDFVKKESAFYHAH